MIEFVRLESRQDIQKELCEWYALRLDLMEPEALAAEYVKNGGYPCEAIYVSGVGTTCFLVRQPDCDCMELCGAYEGSVN